MGLNKNRDRLKIRNRKGAGCCVAKSSFPAGLWIKKIHRPRKTKQAVCSGMQQYLTTYVTTVRHRKRAGENWRVSGRSEAPVRAGNLLDKVSADRAAHPALEEDRKRPAVPSRLSLWGRFPPQLYLLLSPKRRMARAEHIGEPVWCCKDLQQHTLLLVPAANLQWGRTAQKETSEAASTYLKG